MSTDASIERAVSVDLDGHVATVEIHRPPHNWFDIAVMTDLADAILGLDDEAECRAVVLASEGRNFCAGADLKGTNLLDATTTLYEQATRLFSNRKPIVAAVQGAAVGGGLGLADRLVAADELRDAALAFASEIASSAPLALLSIRETMRGGLADQVRAATARENQEQQRLRQTADFQEGVAATAERRPPNFTGR
jgi:enoyl-CoA hydratase/carnithine racemase